MTDTISTTPRHSAAESTPARRRKGSVTAKLAAVVLVVLVAAVVTFVLQNTERLRLSFIAWDLDINVGYAMLGAVAVGIVITFVLTAALKLRSAVK
ncbi:DUF1049 domain-containing protein [Williamsia deligens]|uniref:DUF1049 domain-containing protein n=1 Tax=Williamsia deligens TaxID=321325 RepID=A0ABW3G994_9NOCA|nr:DUF1049 domain-containing protein [Williamsia deligens]MCP2193930.1 hypothetical protein [Williamsia deligens]